MGKVGTGIVYIFTYGLFFVGWFVDIITVATGSFQDKQGRVIQWQRKTTSAAPAGNQNFVPGPDESLEFVAEGKKPETDSRGRVVARLGLGSQFDIPVHWVDDADIDAITRYFQGSKKLSVDEDGTLSKRFRLIPVLANYWGGQCFRLDTPDGQPAFEIRDNFEDRFGLAKQIINDATPVLIGLAGTLSGEAFVYDVAVRVDFSVEDGWGDDGDDETPELVLDNPSVRIRNPLRIQIRSASD